MIAIFMFANPEVDKPVLNSDEVPIFVEGDGIVVGEIGRATEEVESPLSNFRDA